LILASGSPQRRAILEQVGVAFRVEVPEVDELSEGDPRELVVENALRKVRAVEGALVLGVDTLVVHERRVYAKPGDAAEAERNLRTLSGSVHEVVSGIALRDEAMRERTDVAVTRVRFRALGESEIAWYLGTGEWRGRAGGYAIQLRGAALVESIEGDYLNVVGLPVAALLGLYPELLFG
jgi:septum formation protein